MSSYRMKIVGSVVLAVLSIVLIVGAVYSGQASQRISWVTNPGQSGVTVSYTDRDYIGNTLLMYGTIANAIVGAVLLFYAVGILIVK